jgi:hypothetical protein
LKVPSVLNVSDSIGVVFSRRFDNNLSFNLHASNIVFLEELGLRHSAAVLNSDGSGHPLVFQDALDLSGGSKVWNVKHIKKRSEAGVTWVAEHVRHHYVSIDLIHDVGNSLVACQRN